MTPKFLISVVLLVAASTGCSYLEARGRDFEDCFKLSVGAGLGVYAGAHVGPLGFDAGFWDGYKVGIEGKSGLSAGHEQHYGAPFPLTLFLGPLACELIESVISQA